RRCDHVFGVAAIVVDPGHLAIDAHREIAASTFIAGEVVAAVPADPDARAFLPRRDSRSESIDAAGHFVTRHTRILQARPEPILHHDVAVADSARVHLHAHLPRPWFGNAALNQLELAACFADLGHLHHESSCGLRATFHLLLRVEAFLVTKDRSHGKRLLAAHEAHGDVVFA